MSQEVGQYKGALEALLFISDKPITVDQFGAALPELKPQEIVELLKGLQDDYLQRQAGMVIVEIAGGWQMLSSGHVAGYIREFYKTKSKEKLSRQALETLAIIAYKQPTGRADVEVIRGVNSDGTVAHLLNKGLIQIVGRKEVPGRPFLYGTTKEFLDYFGLKSLDDLPKIQEFTQLGVDAPQAIASPEQVAAIEEQAAQEQAGDLAVAQESSGVSRGSEQTEEVIS